MGKLFVSFIDTADSYGPFVSEDIIAEALAPYRGLTIATKGGLVRPGRTEGQWPHVGDPNYLGQAVRMSLRRLKVERIDLWQLHRIDPKVPVAEQFEAIRSFIDQGFIRFAGLSQVNVEEIEAARKIFPVATVQNRYNLADRADERVLDYCEANGIGFIPWFPLAAGAHFDSPIGRGAVGIVEGRRIVLGNARFLRDEDVQTDVLAAEAERLRQDGATAIFAAVDGRVAGVLAIADPVKGSTSEALAALKAAGVKVVMLTGDNATTAKAVARRLGIDDVEAEVLPDQKGAVVQRYKRAGRVVAMAGDGVNDAPALAAADVGIAMGTGADVAIESAGVTLLKGDLTGIARARSLSQATMGNIRQNLFFAFIYNALGIPVAAGVLYPFFGILLSPVIAAAAMALSSVSVVGNAARLRRVQL